MQTSVGYSTWDKITQSMSVTYRTGERLTLGASIVEKDLGVLVDTNVKFSKHVEEQVNKANRTLALIKRSFQFLNRESMNLLFTALVQPHLRVRICCLGTMLPKKTSRVS